ncbi:GNAT family N-acetyltransferase [uncultured Albimonas sp.]|uniref:GNAT family N-acetyltransferase n=1 Tax=uncultured Albimonas sp. TaxID=1331701 RepID=UPI0030EC2DEF|tara:strand:- start:779 stop:1294 length:516 start_codon:yes stop_codon:yes gene_type:complete
MTDLDDARPEPPSEADPELTLRRSAPLDLSPLARLLADESDLALANPNAARPFCEREWRETWLGDLDDAAFYVTDPEGREVGFFALRVGVGPEVRHLAYLCLDPAHRGGAGRRMTELVEEAARALGALSVTLKVELDNAPALTAYRAAGYEELSQRRGMATLRLDLEPVAA